jgi:chromosome segregation ATPase
VERREPGSEELAELRASLESLSARVESLPVPSEEWRDDVAALRRQIENALSASVEVTALRTSVEDLAARVESLPVASEEWREPVAELAARVEGLSGEEWRRELAEVAENLRTRLERVEQREPGSEELAALRASLESLSARVESLPVPSEEWRNVVSELAARVDGLSGEEWRRELAEVAENLRTRLQRVEQREPRSEELAELRSSVEDLAARVESLPAPSEEWREPVADLAARVDGLASGDLREELGRAAETLRARIERVEEGLGARAANSDIAAIAERVEELGGRLSSTETLASALAELSARVDSLPLPSDEWRQPVADLTARVDEVPESLASWRLEIDALAERVGSIRTDDWHAELAEVAGNLRARLERLESDLEGSHGAEIEELRGAVAALSARLDLVPVSADELRRELRDLAEALHGRLAGVDHRLSQTAGDERLAELASRVDELSARVDEGAGVEARLHDSLSAVLAERVEQLRADGADVRGRLGEALRALAGLTGVTGRVDELESRLAGELESAAGLGSRLDELTSAIQQHERRLEKLSARGRELAERRDPAEIEQLLSSRIEATEAGVADLGARIETMPATLDERLGAVDARAAAASRQAASDVESLRRELDDVRAVATTTGQTAGERIDAVANELRGELQAANERFAGAETVGELRSAVEGQAAQMDELAEGLASVAHRTDEAANAQSADLDGLRARLQRVESALADAPDWSEAVGAAEARVESLEARLIESSTAEAVERDSQVESLRGELNARVDAVEERHATRNEIRDLRDVVGRVETRLDEQFARDEAVARATEAAVREGIAELGERLTASGDAYLETGKELSRSLAGLGLALEAADTHAAEPPRSTDRPTDVTVFLAFAPTADGYRLVECAGAPPELDQEVEVDGCEGTLVVTRSGASPLPFDARRCVYLERV